MQEHKKPLQGFLPFLRNLVSGGRSGWLFLYSGTFQRFLKVVQSVPTVESAAGSGDKSSSAIKNNKQPASKRQAEACREPGDSVHGSVTQTTTPLRALWRVANRHFRAAAGGPSESCCEKQWHSSKCLAGWFAGSLACWNNHTWLQEVARCCVTLQGAWHRSVLTGQVADLCDETQRTIWVAQFPRGYDAHFLFLFLVLSFCGKCFDWAEWTQRCSISARSYTTLARQSKRHV